MAKYPLIPSEIRGTLEISHGVDGVLIAGDPQGLRSLARLLDFLAGMDPNQHPTMPDGEREHTHLYAGTQLSPFSVTTELCRLDAKGTGEFPKRYAKQKPVRRPEAKRSKR